MLQKTALALGIALVGLGLVAIGGYLAGLIDIIAEQPADRSWIFWGFGFAGMGAALLVGGGALLALWWQLRKSDHGSSPPNQ